MTLVHHVARRALAALAVGILAVAVAGCMVDASQMDGTTDRVGSAAAAAEPAGLPVLGPVPNLSHWHAAYVVRICDDVLEPFTSSADPLGIHSHADGLIHIHPFFDESGYENATLGLFADAMGVGLDDGEITLPGGGTWRDGDLCNGEPGRVFVDKWEGPDPASPRTRLFSDLADVRYLADGELYQIAFAPADSPPVVPPSRSQLDQVSDLSSPPDPWVDVPIVGPESQIRVWAVAQVDAEPCTGARIPESVLFGAVRCYTPGSDILAGEDAIAGARAVILNREPAVELRIGAPLAQLMNDQFPDGANPFSFAIEIDGQVVTAPLVSLPQLDDRIVIAGGFSVDAAQTLAAALDRPG